MRHSNRLLLQALVVLVIGIASLALTKKVQARGLCDDVQCISVGSCGQDPSPPSGMCSGGCGGPICTDNLAQCGGNPGYTCAFAC